MNGKNNDIIVSHGIDADILAIVESEGKIKSFSKNAPFKSVFQHVKDAWDKDRDALILLQDPGTVESSAKQASESKGEPIPSRYALMDKVSIAKKLKRYILKRKDRFPGAGFQVVKPRFHRETGKTIIAPDPSKPVERVTAKGEKPPVGRIVGDSLYITQDELMEYLEDGFDEFMGSEYMVTCDEAENLEIDERYEEALKVIDKAIGMEPGREYAWHVKGGILTGMKRYDEAMACFDKTLEMDSTYTLGYNGKGNVFHELGLYREAIEQYDKALEIIPSDGRALAGKGLALHLLERSQEAVDCFDEAIENNPVYMPAWEYKMEVLSELGRAGEMIEFCDSYIKKYPGEMFFVENKMRILEMCEIFE
ncbi:MAG: tetratricopeptide repeat protein [Candidatus Hodarchaeota archaeon]